MDRGFIPPESDEQDRFLPREDFLGEFGERDRAPEEVDTAEPRIVEEPETGEIRPM